VIERSVCVGTVKAFIAVVWSTFFTFSLELLGHRHIILAILPCGVTAKRQCGLLEQCAQL
jgi:hypothetical protein